MGGQAEFVVSGSAYMHMFSAQSMSSGGVFNTFTFKVIIDNA